MKARLFRTLVSTGTLARDFIRSVRGEKRTPVRKAVEEGNPDGVREGFGSSNARDNHLYDTTPILTGKRVIRALDDQLGDMGMGKPYLSSASREFANWVTKGSLVSLPEDDRRFYVAEICWERESIRLLDDEGNEYLVPWRMIKPWPRESDE